MEREYVGIDFHRRRSVVVRVSAAGERLSVVRVDNDSVALAAAVTDAGPSPAGGDGGHLRLVLGGGPVARPGRHGASGQPQGVELGGSAGQERRGRPTDLADMLRLGRLPEAWIAPPAIRELRELVRYRAKLVQLRSGLKAQVHAVMAKEGVLPRVVDMFGPAGRRQLDAMVLGESYTIRVESLRDLIEVYDREIVMLGYLEDGPNLVALAMNGWDEGSPAWWLNLEAHPDAVIRLADKQPRSVHARLAAGDERERLWQRWVAVDPRIDAFAGRRSTETPVIVLEPRNQAA